VIVNPCPTQPLGFGKPLFIHRPRILDRAASQHDDFLLLRKYQNRFAPMRQVTLPHN